LFGIKFAKANLALNLIASRRMNRRIRDKIWVFWSFFVDKRFIFFFKKDSRLGPRRLRSLSRYLLKIAV
jgi:hypothetical protein